MRFLPRQTPVYFPVVAAAGIACGVTVMLTTVFNYFIKPMSATLGLTTTQLSGGLSLHLAMLIVTTPVVGALADRWGARAVICVSALAYGACFLLISRLSGEPLALYATFALAGLAGSGASPIAYNRAIVHRFDRNRGFALGVALSGGGLAAIVLPWVVRPVVVEQGWRAAFVLIAMLAVGAGLLGSFFAGRHESSHGPDRAAATGPGLGDALRTRTFWQMTIALATLGLVIAAMVSHLSEIWTLLGMDPARVPRFQAAMGAATIFGRLAGGALMDRIPAKFVGAGAAAIGAAGLALLAFGRGHDLAVLAAGAAVGTCLGAESDVISFLSSRHFGIRRFARIYGAQAAMFMVGFSAGPLLFAVASRIIAPVTLLQAGAAVLLLSSLVLATLPRPGAITEG